jgi:hypothetical protein
MRRRDVLGTIGVVVAPQAASAKEYFYGRPASITGPTLAGTDLLRLDLNSKVVGDRIAAQIARYQQLAKKVLASPEARIDFLSNPDLFLNRHRLSKNYISTTDTEVRLLQALSDDTLIEMSASGNYRGFLSRLQTFGLLDPSKQSKLKSRIVEMMQHNLTEIRERSQTAVKEIGASIPELLESKEIEYLYSQLKPSVDQNAVATVAVAVVIAATVVTYISVAVGVTVAITAGFAISIAVTMGVTASGGCLTQSLLNSLPGSVDSSRAEDPPPVHCPTAAQFDRAAVARALLTKRLTALDPDMLQEAQTISRTARLLRNDGFLIEASRDLVRREITAFVEAAEEVDLIRIPAESRPTVLEAMQNLALKAAALD